jgi:hypothetical protein
MSRAEATRCSTGQHGNLWVRSALGAASAHEELWHLMRWADKPAWA